MIFKFLSEVAAHADENLMTASNLGVPLGPCLLRLDGPLDPKFQVECWDSKILEFLLIHQAEIFTPLMEQHDRQLETQLEERRRSGMLTSLPPPLVQVLQTNIAFPVPLPLSSSSTTDTPKSLLTSPGSFEFKVRGFDPVLVDQKIVPDFSLKLIYGGRVTFFHRKYEDFVELDRGLRDTYGPKGVKELPKRTSMFGDVDPSVLCQQLEEYLNWLSNLFEVAFLKYFKDFTLVGQADVENASSYFVWAVSVKAQSGELLGYLKVVGSEVEVVSKDQFDKSRPFLWTLHHFRVRKVSSNDVYSFHGIRNVESGGFLYRSRLISRIKWDVTFSERTCVDITTPVWTICKGSYSESSPFCVKERFLSISSSASETPCSFSLDKVYDSIPDIP
jgi:hypothetical protein